MPAMKGNDYRLRQRIFFWTGIFCLACVIVPAFYGVLNFGSLVIAVCGLLLIFGPRYWHIVARRKPVRRLAVFLITVFVSYSVTVSLVMLKTAYFMKPPESGRITVVVLGSKINGDSPSLMLKRRLDVAKDYLMTNPDAFCIVTGGQGADEDYPESFVMKNYLVAQGIAEDRIITEWQSTSTQENLLFASRLISDSNIPIIIATDGFHQLRAHILASAYDMKAYSLSSFTPPGLLPAYWVRDMLGVSVAWLQTK